MADGGQEALKNKGATNRGGMEYDTPQASAPGNLPAR